MAAILQSDMSRSVRKDVRGYFFSKSHFQAPATDPCLIKQIAAGDRRAMATFYRRHSLQVYRFALRLTGNPAWAEDIASDVFADVWRHAASFKADSQVSTWLLAITRNKSLTAMRQYRFEPLDEAQAFNVEDPADGSQTVLEKNELGAVLRKCLLQLPTAQREVIDLVYYHGKSVDEAAQIVGMPANTVKTRMFYARRRLRALLGTAGIAADCVS